MLDEARYLFLDDVVRVAIGDDTSTLTIDVPGSHFPVAMFHWTLSVSATCSRALTIALFFFDDFLGLITHRCTTFSIFWQ